MPKKINPKMKSFVWKSQTGGLNPWAMAQLLVAYHGDSMWLSNPFTSPLGNEREKFTVHSKCAFLMNQRLHIRFHYLPLEPSIYDHMGF